MNARAAIGIGSNVGDRERHLENATRKLEALGRVVGASSWYETAPVGGPEQGPYLNAVVVIETELEPRELLGALLEIEHQEGRKRRVRWGPRTLDLDILLYDDRLVDEEGLTVPHPELTKRRFALVPLLEAWPGATLPDGTPLEKFLPEVQHQEIERVTAAVPAEFPTWAPVALFLLVGMGAVVLWWLMDIFL